MRLRIFAPMAAAAILLLEAKPAWAGMPMPVLTDWAALRLETISFALVVLLSVTAAIRGLWNALARDFPRLPQVTYSRALAAVLLWAMALGVVLTMIAGARELLTPGAWQKQGVLYKVASGPGAGAAPSPAELGRLRTRHARLADLKEALWRYASAHAGRFPPADDRAVDAALWEVPGGGGTRYIYVPGRTTLDADAVLACEPELFGPERLVLQTDGKLLTLTSAELRRRLPGEKKP